MNELHNIVKYLNYNYIKGHEYEKYVLEELNNHYDIKEGYLWKNVPDNLLIDAGIIGENELYNIKNNINKHNKSYRNFNILLDTGIDIICRLKNNSILLVQCKAYSSIISQKHLSGFFRTLLDCILQKKNNIIGIIVHTSSVSELITSSYCYKSGLITDIYIPFTKPEKKQNKDNKKIIECIYKYLREIEKELDK